MTVNVKKGAARAAMAGALGIGFLGLGSGIGQAAPGVPGPPVPPPTPPVPGPLLPGLPPGPPAEVPPAPPIGVPPDNVPPVNVPPDNVPPPPELPVSWDGGNVNPLWVPGMPPGQNPWGPPGQVMKMPTIGGVPNPFYGVPPGRWGDVTLDIPQVWLPGPDLLPDGIPAPMEALPLVWNAVAAAWGVFVDGVFVPYPIALPAP